MNDGKTIILEIINFNTGNGTYMKKIFIPIMLVFIVFFSGCENEKVIPDYYLVKKETYVFRHVTLSGYSIAQLQQGDTIRVVQTFTKSAAISFNGDRRYVSLSDIEKLNIPVELVTVTETSEIPPEAQQFLFHYANYEKWQFWAITAGLIVILFGARYAGMFLMVMLSEAIGREVDDEEKFLKYAFFGGFIIGVWYIFYPETTEGIIYRLDFLRFDEQGLTNTSYIIVSALAVFLLSNITLLFRTIKYTGKYFAVPYLFYTIFGAIAFIAALYLATASYIALIIYFIYEVITAKTDSSGYYSSSSGGSSQEELVKKSNERNRKNAYEREKIQQKENEWKNNKDWL